MLPGFPLLLFGRQLALEPTQSLPAMTSDSAPTGHVASASSYYNVSGNAYPPFQAFDQASDLQKQWITANGDVANCWVQRKTPNPIIVGKYAVSHQNSAAGGAPKNFSLLGSNDGTNFVTLDSQINQTGWRIDSVTETRSFIIASPSAYLYHRLLIASNNGSTSNTGVKELELFQMV